MQTDWIGKSYGAEVEFPIEGRDEKIKEVWTTIDNLVKEMVGKNNG